MPRQDVMRRALRHARSICGAWALLCGACQHAEEAKEAGEGGVPHSAPAGDGGAGDLGSAIAMSGLPLCSGSAEVRLAARVAGGGPTPPGTNMLAENGWQFLLVDGSCNAWLLPGDNDELLHLTLSPTQEESLAQALKLGGWGEIAAPAGGCSDAPDVTFRLDQQRLSGSACGAPPGSAWSDLIVAFHAQLDTLGALATPVGGDLRYLLFEDDGPPGFDRRMSVLWPLPIPPATAAVSSQAAFQYQAGSSRLATASDAAALRAIRTTSKNGAFAGGGGIVFDYTPVVDARGARYRLFIRDEVPLANGGGLFPVGTF